MSKALLPIEAFQAVIALARISRQCGIERGDAIAAAEQMIIEHLPEHIATPAAMEQVRAVAGAEWDDGLNQVNGTRQQGGPRG